MSERIFVIVGPPGSGKSLLLRILQTDNSFRTRIDIITKISNRRRREDEGKEIKTINKSTSRQLNSPEELKEFVERNRNYYSLENSSVKIIGPMQYNELEECLACVNNDKDRNILHNIYRVSNKLPSNCDIVYEQYTKRYGLDSGNLVRSISKNKSACVIVNDMRAIRELKSIFGDLIVVIFLYRKSRFNYLKFQKDRKVRDSTGAIDYKEGELREKKTTVIIKRYMDNIEIFNHVILNTTENKEDLRKQFRKIYNSYKTEITSYNVAEGLYE